MNKILINEILRNKILMGLREDSLPSKISVSKDGTVNFWDLETKKVYRYKLIANTKVTGNIPIDVKSINIEDGTMEYLDPDSNEIKIEKINEEAKNNILQNYKNGSDIENLHTFKQKGFTVTINLKFIEEAPITIK